MRCSLFAAVIVSVALLSLSPLQAQDEASRPPMTRELYAVILAEAKGGEPNAQNTLGTAYRIGWGVVQQDYPTSSEWYRLAAEQGHEWAQANLGSAYAIGRGVPEDPIQAHMWLNLAASRMSGEEFETVKKLRDQLTDEMSVGQLNAARKLAAEWNQSTWDELQASE